MNKPRARGKILIKAYLREVTIFKFVHVIILLLFFSFSSQGYRGLIENKLRPFISDGCSNFPDGNFLREWRVCCIEHDIKYWAGGTHQKRLQADTQLHNCVEKIQGKEIADLMFFGVRIGGHQSLPTSWHWGYGWTIHRNMMPLSRREKKQIYLLSQDIPADLGDIDIIDLPIIPIRSSLTQDYCLDIAYKRIFESLGRPFSLKSLIVSQAREVQNGYIKHYDIKIEENQKKISVDFLLEERSSCNPPLLEITARKQIQLKKIEYLDD